MERVIMEQILMDYQEYLYEERQYKLTSINSFLVAANRLFEYLGWYGLRVKTYRMIDEGYLLKAVHIQRGWYEVDAGIFCNSRILPFYESTG